MNIDSEQKVCLSYGLFSFAGGGIGGVLLFAGRVLNDHGGFVSVIEIGILAIVTGKQTLDRKSTRLNSSHITRSRMPSSA